MNKNLGSAKRSSVVNRAEVPGPSPNSIPAPSGTLLEMVQANQNRIETIGELVNVISEKLIGESYPGLVPVSGCAAAQNAEMAQNLDFLVYRLQTLAAQS